MGAGDAADATSVNPAGKGKVTNDELTDVGVTGFLGQFFGVPKGDFSQSTAQFIDVCTCALFAFCFGFAWFRISNYIFPIRSKREDEISGLDIPEMGVEAYPDFHVTDKTSPRV